MKKYLKKQKCAKRLVVEKFNLIDGERYAPCKYCGQGYYQIEEKSSGQLSGLLGLQVSAVSPRTKEFKAMSCDHCGHTQIFRVYGNDWGSRVIMNNKCNN